jgi:ATP-dependent DNA helicase RecG
MALALLRTGRALTCDEYRLELGVDTRIARAELADLTRRRLIRMISQRRWARYVLNEDGEAEEAPDLFSGVEASPADAPSDETNELRERQERILTLLRTGPRSRAAIAKSLGLPDRQVRYALTRLVDDGKIIRTGPARSPNVAYRLFDRRT